jgi:two-component system nitrate/nitrite sensor histidine kinase NarX
MPHPRKLSAKLVGIQVVFLAVALVSIGLTLLVSWRLEGSAAAINDAGSLRMRAYRLAYLAEEARHAERVNGLGVLIREDIGRFEEVVATLRSGDPVRPLFVPRTPEIDRQFEALRKQWDALKPPLLGATASGGSPVPRVQVEQFVGVVDDLVRMLERNIAEATSLLRAIQLALVALAVVGATALIYLSFLFIIRPVHQLEDGLARMARGDLSARLTVERDDEFGALAAGFNHMAGEIEESYRTLESRVAEKTASLALQNRRLSTLYDMTAFLNAPDSTEELCRGFLRRVMGATGAVGGAVRLGAREAEGGALHLFVGEQLPALFVEREQCLARAECACGEAAVRNSAVVHVLGGKRMPLSVTLPHCQQAGFGTVGAFPIAAQHQVLGIYNLFFGDARELAAEERHMLESLGQHLGVAIENLRLVSKERELAAAEERSLLARELHDSIAQSLAFLNLQVQMLRRSIAARDQAGIVRVADEIQAGVQESYADVRELLVHFRTRTGEGDVEHGVRTLATRFERQTGVKVRLQASGQSLPLPPDVQLHVMHILQEALANVRKHAHATVVDIEMRRGPGHVFAVRDDGCGFDASRDQPDDDHVGLRIMRERAQRIGATIDIRSSPGAGTRIVLTVPLAQSEGAAA